MENETKETIIDSQETNDEIVEVVLDDESKQEEKQEVKVEKPVETDEQKFARHTRQAEQLAKKLGITKEVKSESSQTSTKDLMALMENKVSTDDISDVEEYAKFKKVSFSDALKSPILKAILADKTEKRNSANATSTGSTKKSPSKLSDEALFERAEKTGQLPDSDEDLQRLVEFQTRKKK